MFRVETKAFSNLYKVKLVNISTAEYVSIIPGLGGNVNEIVLAKNGKKHAVLDGARTYTELMSDRMFSGSSHPPSVCGNATSVYRNSTFCLCSSS